MGLCFRSFPVPVQCSWQKAWSVSSGWGLWPAQIREVMGLAAGSVGVQELLSRGCRPLPGRRWEEALGPPPDTRSGRLLLGSLGHQQRSLCVSRLEWTFMLGQARLWKAGGCVCAWLSGCCPSEVGERASSPGEGQSLILG